MSASATRRTYEPVRRESLDVDDPRAQVFRPVEGGHAYVDSVLWAFDEWANVTKQPGKPHELNQNCKRVLEVLLRRCTDFRTGVCEPSIDTLMRLTRLARPTIVRCLRVLKAARFLNWIRRTMRTDNAPGEGPQVRQVSNAYWVELGEMPTRVAMAVQARLRKKGVKVEPRREPRVSVFQGRWRRRREAARRERADFWTTSTPAEQAARLYPNDPQAQAEHLAMLGKGASSGSGLNPTVSMKG